MVTLTDTKQDYDVEYNGELFRIVVSYNLNVDYEQRDVLLDGEDITNTQKGKEVMGYFEENL